MPVGTFGKLLVVADMIDFPLTLVIFYKLLDQ